MLCLLRPVMAVALALSSGARPCVAQEAGFPGVLIEPAYQGCFTHPGGVATFRVSIRNVGEAGPDTFDLSAVSAWTIALYAADGTTPLTDTDGDGTPDSGAVGQGDAASIVAQLQAPVAAHVGDWTAARVTARSSLNGSSSETVTLQVAIPAPFAQAYRDDADGAMSLYLAQPGGQCVKKATGLQADGKSPAVAVAPSGDLVYAWASERGEIEYALLNQYGEIVRGANRLTGHDSALQTEDHSPAVAVTPDGRIGIVWVRDVFQYIHNGLYRNSRLLFAVLDAFGKLAHGPLDLTGNTSWGGLDPWGGPQFASPQIAATGDNRFILAWQREHRLSDCSSHPCTIQHIYCAVRDAEGNPVRGITQFTDETTGNAWEGYCNPGLTALTADRALMTWRRPDAGDIYYAVLDSSGAVVKDKTNLTRDCLNGSAGAVDAVQLSDGRIVAGWSASSGMRFAVLDTDYARVAGPTLLSNPAGTAGNEHISMAADHAGHAILTWTDADWNLRRNLYYALVDGNGSILTQPMIFLSSQSETPDIEISTGGYGNTAYSSWIAAGVDGTVWPTGSLVAAAPGGASAIGVSCANHGQSGATGIVLTATLGAGLTYLGDTSGLSLTVGGDWIAWSLPDMGFLDQRQFSLHLGVPGTASIGSRYPVTLTLTANESDANVADNVASFEVMAARQAYLPLVRAE